MSQPTGPASQGHIHKQPAPPPEAMDVTLTINGSRKTLRLAPWISLLDALRLHLDMTGTKKRCDHGQ